MTLLGNGNVGIGTTSPTQKLDVNGGAQVKQHFTISNPATGNSHGNFNIYSTNAGTQKYWNIINKFDVRQNLLFRRGGTWEPVLALDYDDQRVGIGVTQPSQKLDVDGQARIRTLPTGTGSDLIVVADATGVLKTVAPTGLGGDNLGNHTATQNIELTGNWLSGDGGNEGIFVAHDGNVGIGIASSGQKLDVNGGARVRSLSIGTQNLLVTTDANGVLGKRFLNSIIIGTTYAVGSNSYSGLSFGRIDEITFLGRVNTGVAFAFKIVRDNVNGISTIYNINCTVTGSGINSFVISNVPGSGSNTATGNINSSAGTITIVYTNLVVGNGTVKVFSHP
ncbi:MAG: hypothetical protein P8M02_05385 [Flavobacteriaceae bacterium]|nr:hypothetical protein [Flavobacteriaceae bacterium]MDG2386830.1 hypothetical protein [Flavobacteriaceae bacterium]